MLKKFKKFLFESHYSFTEKQLESLTKEVEQATRKDYIKEISNMKDAYHRELSKNYVLQHTTDEFEKEIIKLTIDNDIMKSQVKEMQDEKIIEKAIEKSKGKSKNVDLLKDIFPDTYEIVK